MLQEKKTRRCTWDLHCPLITQKILYKVDGIVSNVGDCLYDAQLYVDVMSNPVRHDNTLIIHKAFQFLVSTNCNFKVRLSAF